MTYNLPPLNWLRAFEASARRISFTSAAKELNLTPAAVSYQVRSLEEHLGFPLFERLPRSLRLTDMGQAYMPSVQKTFAELSSTTTGLFGMKGEASVKVRAPISFAAQWLAPRLNNFVEKYPDIGVRLYTSNWVDHMIGEKVDADIRYGDGDWEGEYAELLFSEEVMIICSQAYLDNNDPITSLGDLAKHKLIHIMGVKDSWQELFHLNDISYDEAVDNIRVDNSLVAMQMAIKGMGIALIYKSLCNEYLDEGKLVPAMTLEHHSSYSHYLILPDARLRPRPEVLLFRDWLRLESKS